MANFEAINLYWNKKIIDKNNILDVYYEDLVENKDYNQKKNLLFFKFLI